MSDESDPRRPDDPWWRSRTAVRDVDPAVGAMLAGHRRARGWSLEAASRVTTISASHLWKLEAGQRAPSLRTVACLVVAFDLDDHDRGLLLDVCRRYAGRSSPYRTGETPHRVGTR